MQEYTMAGGDAFRQTTPFLLFEWFCNFKFSLTPNFDQVMANHNSQTSQLPEAVPECSVA
jgi:hypothetical protein